MRNCGGGGKGGGKQVCGSRVLSSESAVIVSSGYRYQWKEEVDHLCRDGSQNGRRRGVGGRRHQKLTMNEGMGSADDGHVRPTTHCVRLDNLFEGVGLSRAGTARGTLATPAAGIHPASSQGEGGIVSRVRARRQADGKCRGQCSSCTCVGWSQGATLFPSCVNPRHQPRDFEPTACFQGLSLPPTTWCNGVRCYFVYTSQQLIHRIQEGLFSLKC